MRVGANYIEQFDIIEDKILIDKNVVNALNHMTYVTRSGAPILTGRRIPSEFWIFHEGLNRGTREGSLRGAPTVGGVLR